MKPLPLALLTCGLLAGTPALAGDLKAFYFGLKRNTQTVEGVYVVDGYSFAEMRAVMGQYCEGGQIGQFTHIGKPRKKRGALLQKFKTTCTGGMPDRFKGKRAGIEVEHMTKGEYRGRHLAEITTSDGLGNIVYLRETVSP